MFEAPLSYAMLSDTGRVRQRNEDACAADLEHGIFVVCDGVGGAAGGEIASQLAAKTLMTRLKAAREAEREKANGQEVDAGAPDAGMAAANAGMAAANAGMAAALQDAFDCANHAVHSQSQEQVELFGMATTMVAVLFHSGSGETQESAGTVWLANVGDSRCYRLREGRLEQLTQDHSLVGEQVRSGLMTREQAEISPVRNVITRAIGSESEVKADVQRVPAGHGDIFLLASDGLTRELSDEDVAEVLSAHPTGSELELVCEELVRRANERGGGDNITCLLVRIR